MHAEVDRPGKGVLHGWSSYKIDLADVFGDSELPPLISIGRLKEMYTQHLSMKHCFKWSVQFANQLLALMEFIRPEPYLSSRSSTVAPIKLLLGGAGLLITTTTVLL